MKKIFKFITGGLALMLTAFAITSCGSETNNSSNTTPSSNVTNTAPTNSGTNSTPTTSGTINSSIVTYRIHLTAVSGKPLEYVSVKLLKNGKEVAKEYSDANGYADFTVEKDIYVVSISTPDGYALLDDAAIYTDATGTDLVTEVKFTQHLIEEEMPEDHVYSLGDSMYNFSYTDIDGNTIELKQLLEENDVVALNFWYTTCTWCVQEFPALEEAYKQIKDSRVAVVAINPGAQISQNDTAADIDAFRSEHGLTFPFVIDTFETRLCSAFQLAAFPTTVFIDRYGIVSYVEEGAITLASKWLTVFNDFLGDDYEPKFETNEIVLPTTEYPGDEAIAAAANQSSEISVAYRTETNNDAKYNWPWVVDENEGAIKPSNYKINNSYSILYMDVTIPANKVLAFDYKSSTETADCLYFLKDNRRIGLITGITADYETKYLYVSGVEENITIGICYQKDSSGYDGDDTVYIKNVRFVDVEEVNSPTLVIRDCATGEQDPFTHTYENYVETYLAEDGYYHVKNTNQLVLVNLLDGYTKYSQNSMYDYYNEGVLDFSTSGGPDYSEYMLKYMLYASNSYTNMLDIACSGLIPVTEEFSTVLKDIVVRIGDMSGGSKEEIQWLELCVYIDQYGTNGKDLIGDPIEGIAPFSAYEAKLGANVINYNRIIVPRGLYNKFVPEQDGIYKIYSVGDYDTDCFIMDETGEIIRTVDSLNLEFREFYERVYKGLDVKNFFTYMRFEAGKTYYILPCFWNTAQTGDLEFHIDYVGETKEILKVGAYATFTSENEDLTGAILANKTTDIVYDAENDCYHPIKNGVAYEGVIYLDIAYTTGVFTNLNLVALCEKGGFNFTKDELGNAVEGEDLTSLFNEYIPKAVDDENDPLYGLVVVDKQLAEILQKLMDKYTFEGVEESWLKLCYYIETL